MTTTNDTLGKGLCVTNQSEFESPYAEPFDAAATLDDNPNMTYLELVEAEREHTTKHILQVQKLKDICDSCPLLFLGNCQKNALSPDTEFAMYGVVGGMTEKERYDARIAAGESHPPISSKHVIYDADDRRQAIRRRFTN